MSKPTLRYGSLPAILEAFRAEDKQIEAAVILTYEFDPELAISLARTELLQFSDDAEEGQLRFKGAFPACLFYDPKRSQNLPYFPGDFEIHYKAKTGFCCHHSKAYAFALNDGTLTLVLGSFNLTESGLFTNRETFVEFTLDSKDLDPNICALFRQWYDFLSKNYQTNSSFAGIKPYLKKLQEKLDNCPKFDNRKFSLELLSSGYDKTGLEQLKHFCDTREIKPTRIIAVSPFFDKNSEGKGVLQEIQETFNKSINEVSIFSSFDTWGHFFFEGFEKYHYHCYRIPEETSDNEEKAIDEFHGSAKPSLRKAKNHLQRKLHAKVLLLLDDSGKGALYIGSANFSTKAWCGQNFELGVVAEVELKNLSAKKFVEQILNVEVTACDLRSDVPGVDKEAEEEDPSESNLPDWLESILLVSSKTCQTSADKLSGQFRFYPRSGHTLPIPTQIGNRFWFSDIELALSIQNEGSRNYLVSQVCDINETSLRSNRVILMKPEDENIAQSTFIPFNIDRAFGIATEYSLLIRPECALSFLTQFYAPRKIENSQVEDSELRENIYEKYQRQNNKFDQDINKSKTHVMRSWITDLGNLETSLINPAITEDKDQLKVPPLHSDFFAALLAHAKNLESPDATLSKIILSGTDKAFMLMELAILACRLATASLDGNSTPSPVLTEKIASLLKELYDKAILWENQFRPQGLSDTEDPYRNILDTYYKQFQQSLPKDLQS